MDFIPIEPTGAIPPRVDTTPPEPHGRVRRSKELPVPQDKLPFWKQPGFKRGVGAVFSTASTICLLAGEGESAAWLRYLGYVLGGIGGSFTTVGLVKAAKRSGPESNGDSGMWNTVTNLFKKGNYNG